MAHIFPELVIGGVLLATFVTYLMAALVAIIVLRPLLHAVGFAKNVQSFRDRRAEPVCDDSRSVDSVVLERAPWMRPFTIKLFGKTG